MTRLMLTLGLAATLAAPVSMQPVLAQSAPLRSGDDVRVTSTTVTGRFTVQDVNAGKLVLRDAMGNVAEVPLTSLSEISISRGPRSQGAGALRGAAIGFAAGAGAGILIGFAAGDDDPATTFLPFTAEEKAAALGIVLGASAGVVGALAGLAAPGHRWERVPLGADMRVGVSRDGGIAATYALRF